MLPSGPPAPSISSRIDHLPLALPLTRPPGLLCPHFLCNALLWRWMGVPNYLVLVCSSNLRIRTSVCVPKRIPIMQSSRTNSPFIPNAAHTLPPSPTNWCFISVRLVGLRAWMYSGNSSSSDPQEVAFDGSDGQTSSSSFSTTVDEETCLHISDAIKAQGIDDITEGNLQYWIISLIIYGWWWHWDFIIENWRIETK